MKRYTLVTLELNDIFALLSASANALAATLHILQETHQEMR